MDNDSFTPQFWRAARLLGLEKIVSKIIETTNIILPVNEESNFVKSMIRWITEKEEKLTARIQSYLLNSKNSQFIASVFSPESEKNTNVTLKGSEEKGGSYAAVVARDGAKSQGQAYVITSDGDSTFLKLPRGENEPGNLQIFTGSIEGTTGNILSGSQFKCTRTAKGKYKLTLFLFAGEELSTNAVGEGSHIAKGAYGFVTASGGTKKQIEFEVRNAAGELADEDFGFVIYG